MKTWQIIAINVLCTILAIGVIFLIASQPSGQPIVLVPPPTPRPLTVYVIGSVQNPGVYQLPQGSRIQDAIQSAGGFLESANREAINLAAAVEDGSRVWAPSNEQYTLNPGLNTGTEIAGIHIATPSVENPININTASQAELETLPGIGPTRAQQILGFRQEHGAFSDISELLSVPGIGPSVYDQIKGLVTVGKIE